MPVTYSRDLRAIVSTPTAFVPVVDVSFVRGAETVKFPITGGQFEQDARRSMRWSGSVTIDLEAGSEYLPNLPGDLLTNFGTTAVVNLGAYSIDGVPLTVPYGRYIVDSSNTQITGGGRRVTLRLVDLANALALYRFESPFVVDAGQDLAEHVRRVTQDRLGAMPVLSDTGTILTNKRVYGLDPETDPWRELQDLVTGFGYRLWYDRNGNLVLDQQPIPDPLSALVLSGPTQIGAAFQTRPPNVIVARGETPEDGSPPIQAVAMDDDNSSPTWAGNFPGQSPYGRITRYYASSQLTSQPQAQQAARALLAREAGAGASWYLSRPFDPTLDPDMVISMSADGTPLTLVLDKVSISLGGETSMVGRAISSLSS